MSRPGSVFSKPQTGAALVEFALVLPLLLFLMLGITEFSYAFYHLNILNKSVQDGALYFADLARCKGANDCSPIYPIPDPINTSGTYYNNAANLVIYGNTAGTGSPLMPNAANYSIDIARLDANHIRVTATYKHAFIAANAFSNLARIVSGSTSGFPNPYFLTASSVMRAQ